MALPDRRSRQRSGISAAWLYAAVVLVAALSAIVAIVVVGFDPDEDPAPGPSPTETVSREPTSSPSPEAEIGRPDRWSGNAGPDNVVCPAESSRIEGSLAQEVVAAGPGASLCIARGEYRLDAPIVPQEGQTLTFEPGAVLTGAQVLDQWERDGSTWVIGGQSQSFSDAPFLSGHICRADPTDCVFEDVFLNDKPLDHVASLSEVGPGKVFFDKDADRIYLGEDPLGQEVEATTLTIAIESDADAVTVRGATVEKVGWMGIRALGDGWTIAQNEIRYSHSTGLRVVGDGHTVRRNFVHHNGNAGIVATNGKDLLFEKNEIARNNYVGFGMKAIPIHEGGAKFLLVSDVVIRDNYSHHNDGDGWWFDANNVDILVEDNIFSQNTRFGLFYEVSWRAVIRNNIFRRNGTDPDWHGSGVRVSTSSDVEIFNNLFELNKYSTFFVNATSRGSGLFGPFRTKNLYVHDNLFKMDEGWVGSPWGKVEIADARMNNRFESNTYLVSDLEREWWMWRPRGSLAWSDWQALGFDAEGRIGSL